MQALVCNVQFVLAAVQNIYTFSVQNLIAYDVL